MRLKHILLPCTAFVGITLACACGWDNSLREYLDARFWLPFAKYPGHFERKNVRRVSLPYAGMEMASETPLGELRAAYQGIAEPVTDNEGPENVREEIANVRAAIAVARADKSLTRRDREEIDLIDAKTEMRAGQPANPEPLIAAKQKLLVLVRTAHTSEFRSEARGWLAHIHYLLGEQTPAGKIYLDELNRNGSNLSREVLLNSLQMTYGYDGGPELLAHLNDYFDTPEHAAFAIELVTNPHWSRGYDFSEPEHQGDNDKLVQAYARIQQLLEQHRRILSSGTGSNGLALLTMRVALRIGDPPAALKIAAMVPANAALQTDPEFNWMLASARYVSHQYAAAEEPLLRLFRSHRSDDHQKAAAAYGLCGVYEKTANVVEQLRFALWLHTQVGLHNIYLNNPSGVADFSVYWAVSGWDLNLLLDTEAPVDAIQAFLKTYPDVPDVRLVKYSLAVRLSRENSYEEAAQIYESIHAARRAARLRQLATLYREANRTDLPTERLQNARYELAAFLAAHPEGIYFNDALWHRMQQYALVASHDPRLTGGERQKFTDDERKLQDDQEERWRAYMILKQIMQDTGRTDLGRRSGELAVRCLRRISERFGRRGEIRQADIEISRWLRG
jgi:hypothetical protein